METIFYFIFLIHTRVFTCFDRYRNLDEQQAQ